jgi:ankyrin repeat protein
MIKIDECDEDGWTALTHAVVLGKQEAVNILIRKYIYCPKSLC